MFSAVRIALSVGEQIPYSSQNRLTVKILGQVPTDNKR